MSSCNSSFPTEFFPITRLSVTSLFNFANVIQPSLIASVLIISIPEISLITTALKLASFPHNPALMINRYL